MSILVVSISMILPILMLPVLVIIEEAQPILLTDGTIGELGVCLLVSHESVQALVDHSGVVLAYPV